MTNEVHPIPTDQLRLFWRHDQHFHNHCRPVKFEKAWASGDGIHITVNKEGGTTHTVDVPVNLSHEWPDFLRGYFNIERCCPDGEWRCVFATHYESAGMSRKWEIDEVDGEIVFPAEGIRATMKADEYARSPEGQETFRMNVIKAFFPDERPS